MKNIKLVALDFDNLCYREPDNMYELCVEAAALVTKAYTNLTYDQSCDLVIKSWKTDRDVMTQVAKHPQCSVSYTELYKHYNAMTRYRDTDYSFRRINADYLSNTVEQTRYNCIAFKHPPCSRRRPSIKITLSITRS
jgi:hypothetical protein